jgi:hypothetical protein
MKDMTSTAATMMEDPDTTTHDVRSSTSTPPISMNHSESPSDVPSSEKKYAPPKATPHSSAKEGHSQPSSMVFHSPEKDPASSQGTVKGKEREIGKKRGRLTPEQQKKLEEQEKERRKAMEARIATLTTKLTERLRPFVEAKHPGEKDDPETLLFEEKMKREAYDLKLESFGVEVCYIFVSQARSEITDCPSQLLHAIGTVYMMKATSFLKSRKFLGM